jgi:hypothetical protein
MELESMHDKLEGVAARDKGLFRTTAIGNPGRTVGVLAIQEEGAKKHFPQRFFGR